MADREYFNNRRRERRKKYIDLLGGKCSECGDKNDLQFDHKNPERKEFIIADKIDAPEDVLLKEVRKCRLLCPTCHKEKTFKKNEHGQNKSRHGTIWRYKKYKCRCNKCVEAMSDYNRKSRLEKLEDIVASFDPLIESLKSIKKSYPNAQLANSKKSAVDYIVNNAPSIIYANMIRCNSLKQCSSVSPIFAAKASNDGFATLIDTRPGHVYNVMLTAEGPLGVDLTALQFKMSELANKIADDEYLDKDPFGEKRAEKQLLEKLIKNPFETIKVWSMDILSGYAPNSENLFGGLEIEDQEQKHPEFGSESNPETIYTF